MDHSFILYIIAITTADAASRFSFDWTIFMRKTHFFKNDSYFLKQKSFICASVFFSANTFYQFIYYNKYNFAFIYMYVDSFHSDERPIRVYHFICQINNSIANVTLLQHEIEWKPLKSIFGRRLLTLHYTNWRRSSNTCCQSRIIE